jgi:VWFA-related protein
MPSTVKPLCCSRLPATAHARNERVRGRTGILRQALCAALIAGAGAHAGAQQTQRPPQPPRFVSTVDVVPVDVNVVTADGRPVRDLTAADFRVTVDGQPRKLVSAQFIPIGVEERADTTTPPAEYSTNVPTPGAAGRLIAIVVDRGSIAPVRAKDVFAAAAKFVQGLQAQDRVGLFSIPDGPQIDFTTDHDAVEIALQRTDGAAHGSAGAKYVGTAEAMEIERGGTFAMDNVMQRECGGTVQNVRDSGGNSELAICMRMVQDEAATIATYVHQRARDTINALGNLLRRLGTGETPTTIVLISEGLVVDNERFVMNSLGPLIAAAHATIFAFKPEPADSDSSEQRARQNQMQERAVNETGLTTVATLGGGEMFRVLANPDAPFKRLATELSGYYLLGFEPETHDRDGKRHKISVDVKRSGVQVRARTEFSVEASNGSEDTKRIITDLLGSPAKATSIPFRLTTYVFQDPESTKIRLLVGIEVERSDPAQLSMGIVLMKADGTSAATFYQPTIDPPKGTGPQTYFATLVAEPGGYQLRAALLDAKGRRGSVERDVRAYMTRMGRFRATQLVIGDGKDPGAGAASAPSVSGNLSSDTLNTYLELFADGTAAFDGTSVRVDVLPVGGANPVEGADAILQPVSTDTRVRAAAASVPLAMLPAGSYVARARVMADGHQVGEMTRPFNIVRAASKE